MLHRGDATAAKYRRQLPGAPPACMPAHIGTITGRRRNCDLDLRKHDLPCLGPGLSLGEMTTFRTGSWRYCAFTAFGLGGALTVLRNRSVHCDSEHVGLKGQSFVGEDE